ncbi:hypothetical protein TrRE_jg6944, partial [Triparma retinervis]
SSSYWDDIVKSTKDPLTHILWWNEADEQWQCLAVCKELTRAGESGDIASYESSLFVST